jgi:hypothetical protein
MPLEVSQSGSPSTPGKANKFEEHGKKFGKKMGNAGKLLSGIRLLLRNFGKLTKVINTAIFGAGATIGSNIVNSIF